MSSSLYSGVSGLALGAGLYRSVSGLWGGASGLEAGFAGGSPYSGASLYLNFLTMTAPTFDSRITFTRGSNATLTDSTGKITYAPNNSVLWSESFENASWSKVGSGAALAPTVTANAGAAPDGTTTADRIQFNCVDNTVVGNRSYISPLTNLTSTIGAQFVASVWVKAYDAGNVGKTIRFTCDTIGSLVYTLTDSWQRINIKGTSVFATTNFLLETRGTFTTQTADVLVWGAQFEQVTYQTTPSTYQATTSSAYYGPRFDYDPVTLAPRGLLVEEQRTNLLLRSEEFDNASWAKTAVTATANATTSPDGTADADSIIETTANSTHDVNQSATLSAVAYTYSAFVKANGRSWVRLFVFQSGPGSTSVWFNVSTGVVGTVGAGASNATITNFGNGWYRCSFTFTALAAAASIYVQLATADNGASTYTGDGTSGIFIYGAQLEAGAFATSYIPTVASTVTRSADVATMTGTNFSGWYNQSEGTFVAGFDVASTATASKAAITTNDGTLNNINLVYVSTGARVFGQVRSGGSDQALLNVAGITEGIVTAVALAYKLDDFAATVNGIAAVTDATGTVAASQNALNIGYSSNYGGLYLNGHIREIAYFNTRQSNARLQTLTAPPLVTTLSLDFTSGTYLVGY